MWNPAQELEQNGKNSRYVTNVGEFHLKVLAVSKSLNKSIMMELG